MLEQKTVIQNVDTLTDAKFLLILAAPLLAGAFCLGYCSGVFGWVGC